MTSTASLLSASELPEDTSGRGRNNEPLTPITGAMILHPDDDAAILAVRHAEQEAQNRFVRDLAFRGGVTETEFETLVLPLLRQNRAQEHNTDNALLSLPPELLDRIARYLERSDLDALRATSRGANHMAADPLLGPNQNRTIVIRTLEDLAAFGAMRQGSRINGPVSVRVDCRELRDADLIHLRNATTVDLSYCRRITNAGLIHLTNATRVDLSWCPHITDAGLIHLRNTTAVNLSGCQGITDVGLASLTNTTTVDLSYCRLITDAGLIHLTNAREVALRGCDLITDAGFIHLRNATTVDLSWCPHITNAGLIHLTNATTVNLYGCPQITDVGLQNLTNATKVNLIGCRLITDAAKAALRARGVNVTD